MRTLKINSLPPSKQWVDRDELMLHACFQILQDCVEKENVDTQCSYEEHKNIVDEIRFLYNWWLERKKTIYNDKLDDNLDNEMLDRLMKIRSFLWT